MAVWGGQGRVWEPQPLVARRMADDMIKRIEEENKTPLDDETKAGIRQAVYNAYTGSLPPDDVMLAEPEDDEE